MQFLLDAAEQYQHRFGETGGYQSIGDAFKNGGLVFLLGILTVFAVLALVWGVLELFHFFVSTLPDKRKKKQNPVAAFTPVPVTVKPSLPIETPITNDEEIVAVIAAAIAAAQTEKPSGEFRVVSFRRK